MLWVFVVCFLLIVVFLFNGKRRMNQGRLEDAGLNLLGAMVCTVAGVIIVQFV